MEKFWMKVISKKKKNILDLIFLMFLYLISLFYLIGVSFKKMLYAVGIFRAKVFSKKVISVGNITVGGTGKTPFVEEISKRAIRNGRNILIVEKGYKRKKKNNIDIVSDGEKIHLNSRYAGDEPFMLARNLTDAKVVVSSNKIAGIEFGINRFSPDLVILDDGFQKRDCIQKVHNVVLINAMNPFGFGRVFPAGMLREPVSALKHADTVIITNSNLAENPEVLEKLHEKISGYNKNIKIFEGDHQPKYFYNITSAEREPLGFIKNKKIIIFSSIGNPEGFEKTVENMGARVVLSLRFKDHHRFKKKEIEGVCSLLDRTSASIILTTEKDEVRINRKHMTNNRVFALKIGMNIKNIKDLEKRLRL